MLAAHLGASRALGAPHIPPAARRSLGTASWAVELHPACNHSPTLGMRLQSACMTPLQGIQREAECSGSEIQWQTAYA